MNSVQLTLLDNIGKISVFLLVIFSIFLLTVKTKKKQSNYIFAAFLLLIAFDLSGLFLGKWYFNYPIINAIKAPCSLIQMPLWYFYVRSVCFSDFSWKWTDTLHLIPFILFSTLFLLKLFPEYTGTAFEFAGEIQYFIYIVLVIKVLFKHKKVYLENYANPDYTAYKWLFQATILFCIAHVFVISRWLLSYSENLSVWLPTLNVVVTISALLVTCWLVMRSMYMPQFFMGTLSEQAPLKVKAVTPNSEEVAKLESFMMDQKPYLDYNLSLEKLANLFGKEEKELSLIINQNIGKHFFDFINEYRINEAKKILENPENQKLTVLEILYQVGFNSKSSFYTAFKKETGQTPLNYRKTAL